MTSEKDQNEPTMEEILASIRQIISEDGDESPHPQEAPEPRRESPSEPEPLDLTQVVNEDGSVTDLAGQDDRTAEELPGEALNEMPFAEPPAAYEEPLAVEEAFPGAPAGEPLPEEPLISPDRASVIQSAIGRLTSQTRLRGRTDPTTLEGLVAELLRPMLKEWLDDNLPRLVERLVHEELDRITKRGG